MAKKSWFNLMKRLFIWDTQCKQEKKEKRRKWVFGRLKIKRLTPITGSSEPKETTPSGEAEEEQSKLALTVKEKFAAIKIQTAFRGYLARKALRALKGIVKLQAIIRGIAVRRQAMSTLKCLQSIVNIHSQVCARRLQMVEERWDHHNGQGMQNSRDKLTRMDSNRERRWDDSILLKEEVDTSYISKKEAVLRRERIKQYSFNHRMSAETERNRVNGRWRYWLEQWVDTQLSKSKELEDLDSTFSSHCRGGEENGGRKLKLRNIQIQKKQNQEIERLNCDRRQCSVGGEHHSVPSSPAVIPTFMAATESAKAKAKAIAIARSTSSPRVRIWNLDTVSESNHSYSPSKKKLSHVSSSINNGGSEVLSSDRMGKMISSGTYMQTSPSLKGLSPKRRLG